MTTGIGGTGPYGEIRALRDDIRNWEYELYLIEIGVRKKGKKKAEEAIERSLARIKVILAEEKAKKASKTSTG